MTILSVTQSAADVLVTDSANLTVTQSTADVLVTDSANLTVTQSVVDVLVTVAVASLFVDFPDSPNVDDVHTYTKSDSTILQKWKWDGTSWNAFDAVTPTASNSLNFPSTPALNEIYQLNGLRWKWNGSSWISDN